VKDLKRDLGARDQAKLADMSITFARSNGGSSRPRSSGMNITSKRRDPDRRTGELGRTRQTDVRSDRNGLQGQHDSRDLVHAGSRAEHAGLPADRCCRWSSSRVAQHNVPEQVAKKAKIDSYHLSLFANFLEKMRSTPDGDGSLLDHSTFLYGSGMSNGNQHDHVNSAIVRRRWRAGQLKVTATSTTKRAPLSKLDVHLTRKGSGTDGEVR